MKIQGVVKIQKKAEAGQRESSGRKRLAAAAERKKDLDDKTGEKEKMTKKGHS